MLVATAKASISPKPREALAPSASPALASRSMLNPKKASSPKAIQWSMAVIYWAKREPSSQPSRGIKP